MNFRELGLSEIFAERLATQNISEATSIQSDIFGPILKGDSILGLSKTGTGKTLSYAAPLVEKMSRSINAEASTEKARGAWSWILVPTRELAVQVKDTLSLLTNAENQVAVVVGGESEANQIDALGHARFVVATPGRLLDLLKQRKILTQDVEIVVMDEADRLLDMGFIDDIRTILGFLKKKPQLICVSATLNLGVEEVAFELGVEPLRFGTAEAMATVEGLDHRIAFVGEEEKFHVLVHFIHERKDQRGIVFSNYREKAHELASRLRGLGYRADALSAQLAQSRRRQIIEEYRKGDLKILVGSDLAARGLDFLDLDYVVNYDLSEDAATYVHRVGRTARAGRQGRALALIGYEDSFRLEKLQRFLDQKITVEDIPLEKLSGVLPRLGPRIAGDAEEEERYANRAQRGHGGHVGGGPRGDRGGPRSGLDRGGPRGVDRGPRHEARPPQARGPQGPREDRPQQAPRVAAPGPNSSAPMKTAVPKKAAGNWERLKRAVAGLFGLGAKPKMSSATQTPQARSPQANRGGERNSQSASQSRGHHQSRSSGGARRGQRGASRGGGQGPRPENKSQPIKKN